MQEKKQPHPALSIVRLYKTGSINLLEATYRFRFLSGLRLDVSREYLLNVQRRNVIDLKSFKTKQNKLFKRSAKCQKEDHQKMEKNYNSRLLQFPKKLTK